MTGEGRWVICFDFPDAGPVFAGHTRDGALGWAPTIATALRFESAESAWRTLENGYGEAIREFGDVVEVAA